MSPRAFVDTVGCAIAGANQRPSEIASSVFGREGNVGRGVTKWNGTGKGSLLSVCAINGTLSHSLDFDDTNYPIYGHVSGHLIPTVVAVSEEEDLSGTDAVNAYLVGHETEVALARAFNMPHMMQGFHPTGTLGTFGATASACRLLRMDVESTCNALALSVSMTAGLRVNVGTMTKPLHSGMASFHGVLAALLAREGWTAVPDAFERPETGFGAAYATAAVPDYDAVAKRLGTEWSIISPFGYQVKRYPSCWATHPPIEASIELHRRLGDRVHDIERIEIGATELATKILIFDHPRDANEARFSLPHGVARALLSGSVRLTDFSTDQVTESAMQAMMRKVSYSIDPRFIDTEFGIAVRVVLRDGETVEVIVESAEGSSDRPLSDSALKEKFLDCLGDSSEMSIGLWASLGQIDGDRPVRSFTSELETWWASRTRA